MTANGALEGHANWCAMQPPHYGPPQPCSCGYGAEVKTVALTFLPRHSGDGYGYGGGAILTVNGVSFMVGEGRDHETVARTILAALQSLRDTRRQEIKDQ